MAGLWSLMFLVRSSGYTAWLASIKQAAVSMRMRTPVRPMPALKLVVNIKTELQLNKNNILYHPLSAMCNVNIDRRDFSIYKCLC